MNLEQRVQTLEEEVQLLKNQIQTTLLAIQEQILTNTYPSLRAEDAGTSTAPMDYPSEMPAKPVEGLRGINRISLDSTDQPIPDLPISKPPAAPIAPPPLASVAPKTHGFEESDSDKRPTTIDWASLNKMDEWICRKIDKMGVQRTRKLIEFYGETKRFSASVTDTLFQLIALYEEDVDPAAEARHHDQPLSLDDTISNFDPPIRTYYAESEVSPVREHREMSVRRPVEPELGFNDNGNGGNHGQPDDDRPDAPRKMILKLIAGLQNAGMDWKKPNG